MIPTVPGLSNLSPVWPFHKCVCPELGDQIKEYLKNFEKEIEKIKDKLKEIYGKTYYEKVVSKLTNKEIAELVQNFLSIL